METTVAVLAVTVIAYGTVSRLIERGPLTGPIVFTAVGLALGAGGLGWLDPDVEGEVVSLLAEATLVLVLFTDAARIDLPRLRADAQLPARMLASLPLTIGLGALAAWWLVPGLGLVAAAVLAAVLAPTDAALGQAVVTDERVPLRIRQTLNVESGLNDGIVLPVVTILLGFAAAGEGIETVAEAAGFVAAQVGWGLGTGVVVGCTGAWVVDRASAREWMTDGFQQLATLASAVACFVVAESLGGNGFIAAFVGGMAFGVLARPRCTGLYTFAEEEGELLTLLVFAVLGGSIAPARLLAIGPSTVLFIVLSLTVLRMAPIALSLVGSGLRRDTVAFLGWFGPRGLATILFGLLVVEETGVAGADQIVSVALWTVLASVVAHGLSAVPLVSVYARRLAATGHEDMAEMEEATVFPTR